MYPNLRPRQPFYGKKKKDKTVGLTEEAWVGLAELASSFGLSRSEFVQQIGLGLFKLVRIPQPTQTPPVPPTPPDLE